MSCNDQERTNKYICGVKSCYEPCVNNEAYCQNHSLKDAIAEEEQDMVNHPKHYMQHPSGIECIDIAEHFGYNLGCVVKYLWRADLKENALQDLEKAAWYLNREIEKRKRKVIVHDTTVT